MDNTPIQGCPGCDSTGGRMSCATHGPNRVIIISDPPAGLPPHFMETQAAILAERDRCRQIAADHVWKCQGKNCNCARQIAYDIMDVAR